MITRNAGSLSTPLRATHTTRLGIVSFLNALPLRSGLETRPDIQVYPAVPSDLADMLDDDRCDVALLPVVDFLKRRSDWELISDACIASDGETLTVRVFSRIPPDRMKHLHVDADSHTSILLARLIWRELYSVDLELIPAIPKRLDSAESVLLIGDKVVREAPRGFGFEIDLGAAWKHLTGLPFVFAAWYGPRARNWMPVAKLLEGVRDNGITNAEVLAREHASRHGWPPDLAVEYLTRIMKYQITAPMRAGMDRFFGLIDEHGFLK